MTFIIAEVGVNHMGNLDFAKRVLLNAEFIHGKKTNADVTKKPILSDVAGRVPVGVCSVVGAGRRFQDN